MEQQQYFEQQARMYKISQIVAALRAECKANGWFMPAMSPDDFQAGLASGSHGTLGFDHLDHPWEPSHLQRPPWLGEEVRTEPGSAPVGGYAETYWRIDPAALAQRTGIAL